MGTCAPPAPAHRTAPPPGTRHDRAPAPRPGPHRTTGGAPPGLRRPHRRRHGPAVRRRQRGRGDARRPAAHRRAALQDPGGPQGRRDEDGPGAVHHGVGAPRGAGRALPPAADQAPGLRSPDVGDQGAPRARLPARHRLAQAARRVRRRPRGRGVDRPGAQGPLGRRPPGRGQGAVPRRRRGADVRPPPAQPGGPHRGLDDPGHRHQAADHRAAGPGRRGAGLRARGRGAGGVRRGVPRRPGLPGPRRRGAHRQGAGLGVDRQHRLPGPADRRGHPGAAQPLRRALRPLPVRGSRPGPACCTPTRTRATSGC